MEAIALLSLISSTNINIVDLIESKTLTGAKSLFGIGLGSLNLTLIDYIVVSSKTEAVKFTEKLVNKDSSSLEII
ncbi:hypothetical protein [Synechocystis sp. PCC 6714]|uniref:hypothetical protein n=1 Tax=Synechocystis sp. (strain PCC 6714) TaxID=1147 RepID=UPI000415462F|nr:hypothetical protein [Synechocystis sp. PCC 6714]